MITKVRIMRDRGDGKLGTDIMVAREDEGIIATENVKTAQSSQM
jgi:hypothetical protein